MQVIIACRGFPNHYQIMGMRFDLSSEDTPNRQVILSRQPLILGDAPATFDGFTSFPHAPASIRSWLGVPLMIGGQVLGMISLDKQIPNYYTQEHRDLALAFAAQPAIRSKTHGCLQRLSATPRSRKHLIPSSPLLPLHLTCPACWQDNGSHLITAGLQQGGIWAAGHHHRVDIPEELMETIRQNRGEVDTETPITLG